VRPVDASEHRPPAVAAPGPVSAAPDPAPASFAEFFDAEYRRVVGLAIVLCGRRAVAEELAQDAFLAAYRHWSRVRHYDNPGAWVRRVLINLAASSVRRRTRELRALARVALQRAPADEWPVGDEAFWSAVRGLPRRQRECIALRYVEDRSVAEIAHLLSIADATVRVHLHDARRALATRLRIPIEEQP
jgi:RNA polymerase sigma-70 factor (ECF subfamily)